jgi:SAM-dependent methyltransferase
VGGDADAALNVGLDELARAGSEHLDPGYVARYDRKASLDPDEDIAVLGAHGFDADSTLIDIGAGTGTFALAAARVCKRVIAVDVSPAMVAVMRRKVSEASLTNVDCVTAGFLGYEHSGPPADVVYTRNAMHHLPDFWKAVALQRIARVLRPDGMLYLRDLVFAFDLRDAGKLIREWLETGRASPEDGWTRDELEAHVRDEFSTFSWLLEPMLTRAGFEILAARHDGRRVYARYLCRRAAPPPTSNEASRAHPSPPASG